MRRGPGGRHPSRFFQYMSISYGIPYKDGLRSLLEGLRHMANYRVSLLAAAFAVFLITPRATNAQAEALSGLLDNATDIDFYGVWAFVPNGDFKGEHAGRMAGVGFELAFEVPGGFGRKRTLPRTRIVDVSRTCEGKFNRRELAQDQPCADTTYALVKRITTGNQNTYEYEPKIEKFQWRNSDALLEIAVGFSQVGALIGRSGTPEIRASVREAPSVSVYGNFGGDRVGMYVGGRTGVVSLSGGRAYVDGTALSFEGSTFQVGPLAGLVFSFSGVSLFAEAAYMWRDIKSLEWTSDAPVGDVPRSANLSGPSVSIGMQFRFKSGDND